MSLSSVLRSIRKIMRQDSGLNGDAQRLEQLGWMLFLKVFCDKDQELELLRDDYTSPIPEKLRWQNWAADDEGITGEELLEFVDRELFPTLREIDLSTGNQRAYIVHEVFDGNNNYMKSGTNLRKVVNKINEIDFNSSKDRHDFGDVYESLLKDLQSAGKSGEFYTPRALTQFITKMVNPKRGETVLDPACGTGGFLTAAIDNITEKVESVEERTQLQKDIIGWEYKPLPYLLGTTNLILHDMEVPNMTFRDSLDKGLSDYKRKDRVDVILTNPPFGGIVANDNQNNFPQNYRTKESADLFLLLMIHLLKVGGRAGIVLPDGSLTGTGVKERLRKKLLKDCNLHTIIRLPNSVFQPYATVATNLLFFEKVHHNNEEETFATKDIWYYEHRLPEGQKSYSKTRPIKEKEFKPIENWWDNRKESELSWKVSIDELKENGFDLDIKNPTVEEEEIEYSSEELMEQLSKSFAQSNELLRKLKNAIK